MFRALCCCCCCIRHNHPDHKQSGSDVKHSYRDEVDRQKDIGHGDHVHSESEREKTVLEQSADNEGLGGETAVYRPTELDKPVCHDEQSGIGESCHEQRDHERSSHVQSGHQKFSDHEQSDCGMIDREQCDSESDANEMSDCGEASSEDSDRDRSSHEQVDSESERERSQSDNERDSVVECGLGSVRGHFLQGDCDMYTTLGSKRVLGGAHNG